MAITNLYYIIPTALPDNLKQFLVGDDTSRRLNKTGTKAVVKRKENDTGHSSNPLFNAFNPYTHAEIKIEMRKPEWQSDEI